MPCAHNIAALSSADLQDELIVGVAGTGPGAVLSVVGIPALFPDSAIGVFGFVGEPGNPIYTRVLSGRYSA